MDSVSVTCPLVLFSPISTKESSVSFSRIGRHPSPDTTCTIRAVDSQRPHLQYCLKHCDIPVQRDHLVHGPLPGTGLYICCLESLNRGSRTVKTVSTSSDVAEI